MGLMAQFSGESASSGDADNTNIPHLGIPAGARAHIQTAGATEPEPYPLDSFLKSLQAGEELSLDVQSISIPTRGGEPVIISAQLLRETPRALEIMQMYLGPERLSLEGRSLSLAEALEAECFDIVFDGEGQQFVATKKAGEGQMIEDIRPEQQILLEEFRSIIDGRTRAALEKYLDGKQVPATEKEAILDTLDKLKKTEFTGDEVRLVNATGAERLHVNRHFLQERLRYLDVEKEYRGRQLDGSKDVKGEKDRVKRVKDPAERQRIEERLKDIEVDKRKVQDELDDLDKQVGNEFSTERVVRTITDFLSEYLPEITTTTLALLAIFLAARVGAALARRQSFFGKKP